MKSQIVLPLLAIASWGLLGNTGCQSSVDDQMRVEQESQLREAAGQAGLPAISNFFEKKITKMLIELRDEQVLTYSYISTPQGLSFICGSIGYGIPYSTQYTNPERYEYQGTTLPQAEPNGLFMPTDASATWVLCGNPQKQGSVVPVYVEANVVVSPFKLKSITDLPDSAISIQKQKPVEIETP